MAALPGYDILSQMGVYSHNELVWMALIQYLVILAFTGILVLAVSNFWLIFVQQKKYGNTTLLMFYVLTITAIVLRVETLITFWIANLESRYFTSTVQPVLKLNVGLITAWTVLELTMRVEQGI